MRTIVVIHWGAGHEDPAAPYADLQAYDVRVCTDVGDGRGPLYCGVGRYCGTHDEAMEWAARLAARHGAAEVVDRTA